MQRFQVRRSGLAEKLFLMFSFYKTNELANPSEIKENSFSGIL
jgi:hypothetical protein